MWNIIVLGISRLPFTTLFSDIARLASVMTRPISLLCNLLFRQHFIDKHHDKNYGVMIQISKSSCWLSKCKNICFKYVYHVITIHSHQPLRWKYNYMFQKWNLKHFRPNFQCSIPINYNDEMREKWIGLIKKKQWDFCAVWFSRSTGNGHVLALLNPKKVSLPLGSHSYALPL